MAQLAARITPNKTQSQNTIQQNTQQQQQEAAIKQQIDYDRSRNEPIYQRRGSNQYYDTQPSDNGKNQSYSQSPHHQPYQQQQQHQYNVYNQNIYVSTNPFISPPSNNYSSTSFGKENTGNYSSKEPT